MIAAYILIHTGPGKAAAAAAAFWDVPGVAETASAAGPCNVTARAQARDSGGLAKLAASRVLVLDSVTRAMTCPVIHP